MEPLEGKIIVRFIKTPGIITGGIAWWTNSLWDHVEFGTPEGTWIGAHWRGGVEERPANYCQPTREHRYAIPVTMEEQQEFYAELRRSIGQKYNKTDILGLLLHNREFRNRKAVICSQFVTQHLIAYFGAKKVLNVAPGWYYLVTPEMLHLSPIFVGNLVSTMLGAR